MKMSSRVYALYVEKEMVGKRFKGTKVKVSWKFACEPELLTHEVVLKHSLVSGKREIRIDGRCVFSSKKNGNGGSNRPFAYSFSARRSSNKAKHQIINRTRAGGSGIYDDEGMVEGYENDYETSLPQSRDYGDQMQLCVKIEDGFDGYTYDLIINGVYFHKHTKKSIMELEELRQYRREEELNSSRQSQGSRVNNLSYSNFTKRNSETLDGRSTKSSSLNKSEASDVKPDAADTTIVENTDKKAEPEVDLLGVSNPEISFYSTAEGNNTAYDFLNSPAKVSVNFTDQIQSPVKSPGGITTPDFLSFDGFLSDIKHVTRENNTNGKQVKLVHHNSAQPTHASESMSLLDSPEKYGRVNVRMQHARSDVEKPKQPDDPFSHLLNFTTA